VSEFVPLPPSGRRFTTTRRVRLADADPSGRLRLDALARFLQDVGNDDTADAGFDTATPWIARRTAVRVTGGWPQIAERLDITTWCGGTGSHWAERRTQLVSPTGTVDVAATWVHIDEATGAPKRLPEWFQETYGPAALGRTISARLRFDAPPDGASTWSWPVRWSDLDVLGHVNNAATWEVVEEWGRRRGGVGSAVTLEYGAAIEIDDEVVVHESAGTAWVVVDGSVRARATMS
jgi:acyl-ACP thioesterase